VAANPVFNDPFLDIPLLRVVADALELDLLKFSFELLVFPLIPFDLIAGFVERVNVELRELGPDLSVLCLSADKLPFVLELLDQVLVPEFPLDVTPDLINDLWEELMDELMLLWLPVLRLLIGRLVLLTVAVDRPPLLLLNESSLPRRRFFVRSFEISLILVSVVRGFSGGKLVALDCVVPRIPAVRLLVDDRTSLRELARLVLLPDLPPADSRSNTLTVPPLAVGFGDSLLGREEIRSMIELLLGSTFLSSFSDLPGRIFPLLSVTSSSMLMIGTDVTYFPSTSVES